MIALLASSTYGLVERGQWFATAGREGSERGRPTV